MKVDLWQCDAATENTQYLIKYMHGPQIGFRLYSRILHELL